MKESNMRNEKITYEDQYQGHPIMTDKAKQLGCKESILQKIDQIMTEMSNRHSKVFFMRYDVRFSQDYDYPNGNELFSQFQQTVVVSSTSRNCAKFIASSCAQNTTSFGKRAGMACPRNRLQFCRLIFRSVLLTIQAGTAGDSSMAVTSPR